MERLKNIHIENYPFSTQELPVLALIKLYLSQTNEPIKAIDTALSSRAGLEFLIEKAKASVAIKDEYSHDAQEKPRQKWRGSEKESGGEREKDEKECG